MLRELSCKLGHGIGHGLGSGPGLELRNGLAVIGVDSIPQSLFRAGSL